MNLSVFYSNVRDAATESGLRLNEVFARIKDAGITAFDVDYKDIESGLPFDEFKINSIYAFFDFTQDGSFEEAKKASDIAAESDAVMMFVPKLLPEDIVGELKGRTDKKEIFDWLDGNPAAIKTAETLEKLSVYGEKLGIKTAVENFDSRRSLTERKAEIEWLFEKAPHLKFNLDTGNSITCGENILELYGAFKNKIVNVHCKDRLENNKTTAVGTGEMPIIEIRNRLIKSDYSGSFSVEVFGVSDPLSAIITSAENLRK